MLNQPIKDELARLEALRRYNILDSAPEQEFDDLTVLASAICEAPIALVSFIDANRQWFKSKVGLETTETPRDVSFCEHVLEQTELLIVEDAVQDERFAKNPLVTGEPNIRFYAGAPLLTAEGHVLGTLCVIDKKPRKLTKVQQKSLQALARQAAALLSHRQQSRLLIQTNESLKEKEENYRIVTESASDAIITMTENGTILFANPAVENVFGYLKLEIIGKSLTKLIPDIHQNPQFIELKQSALNSSSVNVRRETIEAAGLHCNGQEIQIEISFGEYQLDSKRRFTVVIRDITARKSIEAKLRESEKRYRFLSEAVPQQVWTATADGLLDYGNLRALEFFGQELTGKLLFGAGWSEAIHPDDKKQCFEKWVDALKTGINFETEFRLRRADNEFRWHLAQAVPMRGDDDKIIKWFGTNTDIHERKLVEETVQKSKEYRNLFQHANDAILIFDPDDEIVLDANDKACEIYGFSRLDFIGRSLKELSQNVEKGEKQLMELLRQKTYQAFESVQFRADGTPLNLLINSSVIEYQGRKAILSINRDVTERKRAEVALHESQQMLQLVMDTIPQSVFWKDRDSVLLGCNRFHAQMVGLEDPSAIIGKTDYDFDYKKEEADFFRECDRRVMESGIPEYRIIEPMHKPDGSKAWLETNKIPLRNTQGEIVGLLGTFDDITERKRAEDALRESEYKFRTLLESMTEGLLQIDNNEIIEFVNDRFCEITGYSREELIGKVTSEIFCDEDISKFIRETNWQKFKGIVEQHEVCLESKNNEKIWFLVGSAPVVNSENVVTGTMGVFTNITDRKRAEEQLLHDAFHDGLTGLANRTLFMYHLQLVLNQSKRSPEKLFAVLFIDFDRFKIVNDSLGHAVGDELLVLAARRFESVLRPGDLVARLGGDEFTILLSEFDDEKDALGVAERLHEELKIPFNVNGHEILMSASIGVALSAVGYEKAEEMLRGADIAMYRAKTKGRAQYQVFDNSMHEQALTKLQLETEMPRALEQQEFCLYYQPILSLNTNQIVGFESLVRWQHSTRKLILPNEFIPVAEENGFILQLGRWILTQSCRQLREWQIANLSSELLTERLTISVNLSCKQFMQPDLAEQVAAALRETELEARCLRLEITESHLMENSEAAIATLKKLRALGVELSLDDFGTGYSSLSYLHRLPVSHLKIDQSFVAQMLESNENNEIVQTIIKLAHNLRMKVVAEGIETATQLSYLKRLKCEFGQGFLFSQPMPAASVKLPVPDWQRNSIASRS